MRTGDAKGRTIKKIADGDPWARRQRSMIPSSSTRSALMGRGMGRLGRVLAPACGKRSGAG